MVIVDKKNLFYTMIILQIIPAFDKDMADNLFYAVILASM